MSDAPMLNMERLTWAQICDRFPEQWVVLVGTQWGDRWHAVIRSAIVISHGDEVESWERAASYRDLFRETVHTNTHPIPPPGPDDGPVEMPAPWIRDREEPLCQLHP